MSEQNEGSERRPGKLGAARRMLDDSMLRMREIVPVVALWVLYAVFEGIGVGLLLPVLEYVESGGVVPDTNTWDLMLDVGESIGIEITLVSLLIIAFIPILLRQVVFFSGEWLGAIVLRRTVARLRHKGFDALMGADLSHTIAIGQGDAVARYHVLTTHAGTAVQAFLRLIAVSVLVMTYFVILLFISPPLAAVALVALVGVSLISRRTIEQSRVRGSEAALLNKKYGRVLGERVAAIRLIKMRGQESSESVRMGGLVEEVQSAQVDLAVYTARLQSLIDPAMMLAVFAIVLVGVEALGMSLAGLGIFLFILLRLSAKAKELNVHRQRLSATVDNLLMVVADTDAALAAGTITTGETKYRELQDKVEFRDVAFAYVDDDGEETPVLDGVSLELPRGSLTAIVGRSGAGKSTLVDLLPRLRERTGGEITFDGVPIEELELQGLRRRIGFLTQEARLFDASLRVNLLYGLDESPPEETIDRALDRAHVKELVESLPDGLDSQVGELGHRFSGGERQRISLARELLQDPDILILDEPTSALDSESEQYIKASLDSLHGEKTLIVIAHRLSTVLSADQILVLEDGRIVERGVHNDLIKAGGRYAQLFEAQIVVDNG